MIARTTVLGMNLFPSCKMKVAFLLTTLTETTLVSPKPLTKTASNKAVWVPGIPDRSGIP